MVNAYGCVNDNAKIKSMWLVCKAKKKTTNQLFVDEGSTYLSFLFIVCMKKKNINARMKSHYFGNKIFVHNFFFGYMQ